MGHARALKILSAVAVCVVLLGYVSPVAAGMLLCFGDGTDPDCCDKKRNSSEPGLEESKQIHGTDCSCCVSVDALPSTAGTGSHKKMSLASVPGSDLLEDRACPGGTLVSRALSGDADRTRLSSLRSVVLLI